jgi:putative ATPase
MKQEGYGKGYAYDHDAPDAFSGQDYFPERMDRQSFYQPTDRGIEARIKARLEEWERLRRERQ